MSCHTQITLTGICASLLQVLHQPNLQLLLAGERRVDSLEKQYLEETALNVAYRDLHTAIRVYLATHKMSARTAARSLS